jgi:hypothetical protein
MDNFCEEYDEHKERLEDIEIIKSIDDIERQLQTSADRDTLFTVRWQLPQVSSY